MGYITPNELCMYPDRWFIVDIRKSTDYAKGHIPGAINIFFGDLHNNIEKLPKDKEVLLVCYVGHTASQIMALLRILGYLAKALKFGMPIPKRGVPVAGWVDYNFPLRRKVGMKHVKI